MSEDSEPDWDGAVGVLMTDGTVPNLVLRPTFARIWHAPSNQVCVAPHLHVLVSYQQLAGDSQLEERYDSVYPSSSLASLQSRESTLTDISISKGPQTLPEEMHS